MSNTTTPVEPRALVDEVTNLLQEQADKMSNHARLGAKHAESIIRMAKDFATIQRDNKALQEKGKKLSSLLVSPNNSTNNRGLVSSTNDRHISTTNNSFGIRTPNNIFKSPFIDSIASVQMPKHFTFPTSLSYEGKSDPDDHIFQYEQRMLMESIPREILDACMCKAFVLTLSGPALQWYVNLPTSSIGSFEELSSKFSQSFFCSRRLRKEPSDLFRIVQGEDESLEDYFQRFNMEKISIVNCDTSIVIAAFHMGLLRGSELYKELTMYPCRTMDDLLARIWAEIRWERARHDQHNNVTSSRKRRRANRNRRSVNPYPIRYVQQ